MDRTALARRVVALAMALGLAAEVLLHGPVLGINLSLLVVAVLAAVVVVRPRNAAFDVLDGWLPAGALALAAFVALRADPALVIVDSLGACTLLTASIPALTGTPVTRRTVERIVVLAAGVATMILGGALQVVDAARRNVPAGLLRLAGTHSVPVLRGLLLAIPLLVLFAALFASADAVFGHWLLTVLSADLEFGDLPGRVAFVLIAAWFAGGALWFAAVGQPSPAKPVPASLGAAAASPELITRDRSDGLGTAEALVVVLAVDALFGLFVALQVVYLFGGADTLAAAGTTYADYARRGFFELLFVAALAGALVGGLEAVVARRSRAYVAAAGILLGLTAAVLVSAVLRMRLYQEAYGWTELRFWALAGMVFVGIGLAATAVLLVRNRTDRLAHFLAGSLLVVMVAVNVLGPRSFVADRNLERVFDPSLIPPDGERRLDAGHLASLGDDAIPALVTALPAIPEPERSIFLAQLLDRRRELAERADLQGWPAWNLGRHRAREALATLPVDERARRPPGG
jgi:hypothetical protein